MALGALNSAIEAVWGSLPEGALLITLAGQGFHAGVKQFVSLFFSLYKTG